MLLSIRHTIVAALLFTFLLGGCASTDPRDPFETYNRAVFAFNEDVDRAIIKPVAKAYRSTVPNPVRRGVSNVFSNLDDVVVIINDLLQLKLEQAVQDLTRFLVNSVFGLAGIFDVATHMGLPKHNEDLGQTLGYWGVDSGPYLVLPFLPPSTVRDTAGFFGDAQVDPVFQITDTGTRYAAIALETIDQRAQLLSASRVLDEAALDRYAFVRDAYLQHRLNLVYDGHPPQSDPPPPPEAGDADLELELELERELKRPAP